MKATYQEALDHMKKKPLENYAIFNNTQYTYNQRINAFRCDDGNWTLYDPAGKMKNKPWFLPYNQIELTNKDCSNCDKLEYEFKYLGIKAEKRHCEIRKTAMEYIGLEGEETKFSCSLHEYKEGSD